MSASRDKPFACDPIANASEAPNDGSDHMYATRSGESPWGVLPLKLDPEQTEEFEELERHGLLTEISRRRLIQATSAVAASMAFGIPSGIEAEETANSRRLTLKVNGQPQTLSLGPRTSRLDALRDPMDLTGTQKGCDPGQWGGARTAATGRIVNGSLAEYRVPVSADAGVLDVSVIGIPDLKFNPIGSRGIGEIGITVTAAAVANAISNARAGASASIPSRRTSSS